VLTDETIVLDSPNYNDRDQGAAHDLKHIPALSADSSLAYTIHCNNRSKGSIEI
jgi:hypothetical protein